MDLFVDHKDVSLMATNVYVPLYRKARGKVERDTYRLLKRLKNVSFSFLMTSNSRPDRFVRKCDGPVREHGVALLQTKLTHEFILTDHFASATPLFRAGLCAGIIVKGEGRRRNRE